MDVTRIDAIKTAACPVCKAEQGAKCTKRGKPKKTVHKERFSKAAKILCQPNKGAFLHSETKPRKDTFYSSWDWKRIRYEAIRLHGQRCQCCGWQPGDTDYGHLVVDHIKPRSRFPNLALEVGNLQVLCNDCNMGKSNVYADDFRGIDNWLKTI